MSRSVPTDATAVLLLNLGGPERLEDVRRFLYDLFADPAVIRIRAGWLRKSIAWIISALRYRTSRGYYAQIGGGSPLRRLTEEQAAALATRLAHDGIPARVYVGMSCSPPTIDEALRRIAADHARRLVVLPLYPQFSTTTTGSALAAVEDGVHRLKIDSERRTIREWFDHPGYVGALAETVREEMRRFSSPEPERVHVLYSAHSIPQRFVDDGDPYLRQTERTVALVNSALGNRSAWTLAFQSRVGPVKWLEPSTNEVIERLGGRREKQVLIVPVSFVSDHIETLYEIDILYAQMAAEAGIGELRRAPALNSRPSFIEALGDLVKRALAHPPEELRSGA